MQNRTEGDGSNLEHSNNYFRNARGAIDLLVIKVMSKEKEQNSVRNVLKKWKWM